MVKSIQSVLAGKTFSRLGGAQRKMLALQNAVRQTLAQNAITADCDLSLDGDKLTIAADSAAAVVRIRQILPTLRDSLKNANFPVGEIRLAKRLKPPPNIKKPT